MQNIDLNSNDDRLMSRNKKEAISAFMLSMILYIIGRLTLRNQYITHDYCLVILSISFTMTWIAVYCSVNLWKAKQIISTKFAIRIFFAIIFTHIIFMNVLW